MRLLLVTHLIWLILACPFLCWADEVDRCVQHAGTEAATSTDGDHPLEHCPESGDNCVCRGAVQSSDVRDAAIDIHNAVAPLFFYLPPLRSEHPLHHLTCEGNPTGLASWGDTLTIRALLQDFRC